MKAHFGFALAFVLAASPVFAAGYKVTNLVSNQPGVAKQTDPDLINPWGLAQLNDGAPIWASDNGSAKSTFYDRATGIKQAPVVAIPNALPTGIVAVPNTIDFEITNGTKHGRSYFIFDTISGSIEGWSPIVNSISAIVAFDGSSTNNVYTGLALDTANKHLLAADFARNQVEIFDTSFTNTSSFTDPNLPKHFGPFNVAILNGKVYVAFAMQQGGAALHRDGGVARKKAKGIVDVFDLSGTLQQRLITGGKLNAPWGMAIAPSSFGEFAGALLVGNFGDGTINAYDAGTGAYLGTVGNKKGKPIKTSGLWAIDPGPGNATVTISAGVDFESGGLIALIKPN